MVKRSGINEETRDEEYRVGTSQLVRKLTLPALCSVALAKGASFAGKGRGKDLSLVLKLCRMVCIFSNVITKSSSVGGRSARKYTEIIRQFMYLLVDELTYVMSKEINILNVEFDC